MIFAPATAMTLVFSNAFKIKNRNSAGELQPRGKPRGFMLSINRRNDTVIVLSADEYYRLIGKKKSFKSYLLSPPSSVEDLDLSRDKSIMRDIEL